MKQRRYYRGFVSFWKDHELVELHNAKEARFEIGHGVQLECLIIDYDLTIVDTLIRGLERTWEIGKWQGKAEVRAALGLR